jgi:ABC-type multidrug transport system fused ATPase/permease subunit
MIRNISKMFYLLSPNERKYSYLLFVMMVIMALIEMLGVASILPFVSVLTNPNIIETNLYLNKLFKFSAKFGVENTHQFLFVLGIGVFILLVFSNLIKAFTAYIQVRFIQMREYTITKRLVTSYLHQPYSWFINKNSSELGVNILSEVGLIIGKGLRPMVELFAKSAVVITIIILLVLVDKKVASIVGIFFITSYGIIFYLVRQYLNRLGNTRLEKNQRRFKSIAESFGGIKSVKFSGLEQVYSKNFSKHSLVYSKAQISAQLTSILPRFFLEIVAFGSVIIIILYNMLQLNSLVNILPVISLYIFAGYRLIPALQQIYVSFTQVGFVSPAIDRLYRDVLSIKPHNSIQDNEILSFNDKISLKDINFSYNSSHITLKNINLTINSKSIVGFIGPTGSGKTTIIDIILGLLEPQKGTLEVDGKIISSKNIRAWQKSIGYVPQNIYLIDDTIAANIAYGIKAEEIDMKAIEKASKIANLDSFVLNELPKQYETLVGEGGVRLSGGQKQRIGIARAMYHNPQILIFDEATNALDNKTEQAVMDVVNNLSKNITIILIAHRLNTLKKCDKIFIVKNGQIKKKVTFKQLIDMDENLSYNNYNL